MLVGVRYEKGHGNLSIFARVRNINNKYYNFSTTNWDNLESSNTKVFLTEKPDSDPIDSLYIADILFPITDSFREIVDNTGMVIGIDTYYTSSSNNLTLSDIESSTVLAKQSTLSSISNDVSQVLLNTSNVNNNLDDLTDAYLGNWEISNNQMIFFRRDGSELIRFNLSDKFGNASDHNVFKRVKV